MDMSKSNCSSLGETIGGTGVAAAADSEGDDGDDEASSSFAQLTKFREQWRQELESSAKANKACEPRDDVKATEKAKHLFMQGTHAEEEGCFYEAVRFYRQAVQLVPDIEFQVCESDCVSNLNNNYNNNNNNDNNNTTVENDQVETVDLVSRFQKKISQDKFLCQAEYEQKMTHISVLPMEIILCIFRWVVSSELDMRSLEQLSMVCRGFYLCARDSELWRLACCRVWDVNTKNPGQYLTWRNMFVHRTRLRYNGAYISKTSYVRHGENSFQDQFYRPWHLVEYFRYLRFFPDGVILMLTTPDDPRSALTKLAHRSPRHSAVLVGRYYLHARTMVAVLKRPSCADNVPIFQRYYKRHRYLGNEDAGEQTFHIELQVKDYKQKSNYKLKWTHYAIRTLYKNGNESISDFDLIQNKFPPFWFSRVKSYTKESVMPLQ